jgi:hypothetical protein
VSTVAERYARLLLDQIEGDGLFVRVAAGTEFYLYTRQVFEPELASVAGLEQGEQPRNSWEPKDAPKEPSPAPTTAEMLQRREALFDRVATYQKSKQKGTP